MTFGQLNHVPFQFILKLKVDRFGFIENIVAQMSYDII
jgi:hypothetical protein